MIATTTRDAALPALLQLCARVREADWLVQHRAQQERVVRRLSGTVVRGPNRDGFWLVAWDDGRRCWESPRDVERCAGGAA